MPLFRLMLDNRIKRIAVIAFFAACFGVGQTQRSSDEKQELEMAENAILTRIALLSTSPYICTEQPSVCISADGAELGTALIAARNTPQSLRSLVRLRRFVFDGAYGESYDEYLCKKGKRIETYLLEVHPDQLRRQCVSEFNAAVKANPKELGGAKLDVVCNSTEKIRSQIGETLELTRKPPTSCEP